MELAIFGDSLAAEDGVYAGDQDNFVQLLRNSILPFHISANYAVGGSINGEAGDYVYVVNGVTLQAKGLLGQIDLFIANAPPTDAIIIWSGTNNLVIGAQLDPFIDENGGVGVTPFVSDVRTELNAVGDPYGYLSKVVFFTMLNFEAAKNKLRAAYPTTPIIFIGALPIGRTPLAHYGNNDVTLAFNASADLEDAMENQIPAWDVNCHYVSLEFMKVTCQDMIHLDTAGQRRVFEKLVTALK